MKYIDAEKLISEIKRKIESIENCPFQLASFGEEKKNDGELIAYKDALSLIISLQQEQPSFPSNLDEAAIPESEMAEWMKYGPHTNYPWCSIPDAIKITAEHFFALGKQAGAEWIAGQGVTKEVVIGMATEEISVTVSQQTLDDLDLCPGDKVVVQIRKK